MARSRGRLMATRRRPNGRLGCHMKPYRRSSVSGTVIVGWHWQREYGRCSDEWRRKERGQRRSRPYLVECIRKSRHRRRQQHVSHAGRHTRSRVGSGFVQYVALPVVITGSVITKVSYRTTLNEQANRRIAYCRHTAASVVRSLNHGCNVIIRSSERHRWCSNSHRPW